MSGNVVLHGGHTGVGWQQLPEVGKGPYKHLKAVKQASRVACSGLLRLSAAVAVQHLAKLCSAKLPGGPQGTSRGYNTALLVKLTRSCTLILHMKTIKPICDPHGGFCLP